MTEGDQARDQMAMSELSHRFGVAEPDHATPLHGMTWDEETCTVKSTPSSQRISGALRWIPRQESRAAKIRSSMDLFLPARSYPASV